VGDKDSTSVGDEDSTSVGDEDSTSVGDKDSTSVGDKDSTSVGDEDSTSVGVLVGLYDEELDGVSLGVTEATTLNSTDSLITSSFSFTSTA
jgi:hypothetical protein